MGTSKLYVLAVALYLAGQHPAYADSNRRLHANELRLLQTYGQAVLASHRGAELPADMLALRARIEQLSAHLQALHQALSGPVFADNRRVLPGATGAQAGGDAPTGRRDTGRARGQAQASLAALREQRLALAASITGGTGIHHARRRVLERLAALEQSAGAALDRPAGEQVRALADVIERLKFSTGRVERPASDQPSFLTNLHHRR